MMSTAGTKLSGLDIINPLESTENLGSLSDSLGLMFLQIITFFNSVSPEINSISTGVLKYDVSLDLVIDRTVSTTDIGRFTGTKTAFNQYFSNENVQGLSSCPMSQSAFAKQT